MKRLKRLFKDIKCGLHSGFPICCIWYFITVHSRKQIEKQAEYAQDAHFGYVPCPSCLKNNNRIEVKRCLCGLNMQLDRIRNEYLTANNCKIICMVDGKLKWQMTKTITSTNKRK